MRRWGRCIYYPSPSKARSSHADGYPPGEMSFLPLSAERGLEEAGA
jgi:hypothetical protein